MQEAFEIVRRKGKLNDVLVDHKLSKFNNPAMASRLYELVDEYRLISGKKFEDLDCSDEFSDEKLKKFINKIISDHGFSKASDLAELSSELKASSRNGATPDREPSYEGQVSNAISANIA